MSNIQLKQLSRNDIGNTVPSDENNILVFDFETSGLPDEKADYDFTLEDKLQYWPPRKPNEKPRPKWKQIKSKDKPGEWVYPTDEKGKAIMIQKGTASNPDYWPHSVQFCYLTYNKDGKLDIFNKIIKLPDDATITNDSFKVHSISKEMTNNNVGENGTITQTIEIIQKDENGNPIKGSDNKPIVVGKKTYNIDIEITNEDGQEKVKTNKYEGSKRDQGVKKETERTTIEEAMDSFIEDYNNANVIVAHNIRFDRNMILVELKRLTLKYKDNNLELYTKYNNFMKKFYDNKKEYCTMNHGANDYNKQNRKKIWTTTNSYEKFNKKTETVEQVTYYTSPKLMDLYATLFGYRPDESKLHDAKADVIVCFRCFYMMRYGIDIYDIASSEIKKEIDDIDPHANEKESANSVVENSAAAVVENEKESADPKLGDKRKAENPDPNVGGNAPSVKLILTEPESQFNLRDIGNKIDEEVERGDDIILKFMNDNADVNEKIDGSMPRRSKRLSEQPKIDYAEGVSRHKKKRATRKKRKTNDSQPLRRSKRNQNKKTSKPPVNKPKKYSKKKKAAKKPKKTVAKNTKKKRKTKGRKQTK